MESKGHELKVGIFVMAGVFFFCLSVVLLGGDKFFLKKTYALKVRLPQVQGLAKGSVVSLSGVQVGNISKIDFIGGSADVEVELTIDHDVHNRITEGSKVSIKTQGALGDKYVYIEPGPVDAKPLTEGSMLETDKTPDFIDVITARGAELGEVVEVIKEVRKLFENLNRDGRSGKLVSNMVETTHNLNKLINETREAVVPMASVMRKIDKGQGTLGALVNDPSLHNRLSGFFGESPRNRFLKPLIRDSIQTNEGKK